MLPEVPCNDRDVAAFTPGKKKKIKSAFSGDLASERMRVFFFFLSIGSKSKGTVQVHETSRETFLCCISGLDVRNIGLIIALKNHDHLHHKVFLKYYKSKIFLQGQLAQISFILCKITHGLLTKEPFNCPVVSSYTLTISLLNKNNLLYCSSWVFGPDVWWNNWVWNCWVLFTMQPLQE